MTTTTTADTESTTEPQGAAEGDLLEDLKVQGEQLLAEVKKLIHEGNVRKIIIKNSEDAVIMEIPLTLGLAGAVLLPTLAAVGAIAALVTECSITVVRRSESPEEVSELD